MYTLHGGLLILILQYFDRRGDTSTRLIRLNKRDPSFETPTTWIASPDCNLDLDRRHRLLFLLELYSAEV